MPGFVALLGVALQACAAGPELSSYPRRQIDRPYTLPAGVDAWDFGIGGSLARDDFDSRGRLELQPLSWRISLADDWTLDLGPLPSGIAHQFVRTDEQLLGAKLSLGWGFGSQGVFLAPLLTVAHRMRLARSLAWSTATWGSVSRWTDQSDWGWSVGVATGPLWQVTDFLALQPAIGVAATRPHLLFAFYPLLDSGKVIVPVGLGVNLSVARQWDVNAAFNYEGLGYPQGYRVYRATLGASHLW